MIKVYIICVIMIVQIQVFQRQKSLTEKYVDYYMSMPEGKIEYNLGEHPVSGCGFSISEAELEVALKGPVSEIVFDKTGKTVVKDLLEGLAETEFEKKQIEEILLNSKAPENWRVGEAMAEAYLVDQNNCFFPWPDGRDERKSGSSLPGADLVGFQAIGAEQYFAFGEVKTSEEETFPPGAVYGRTGLKKQLEDLKESLKIKDDLVVYLCHRAVNSEWQLCYQDAAKKYIQNRNNVKIFGVLVRDVQPNQDDLRTRINSLSQNPKSGMQIKLFAIYLPQNSIQSFSDRVMNNDSGGNE